jgi:hypothetical protein
VYQVSRSRAAGNDIKELDATMNHALGDRSAIRAHGRHRAAFEAGRDDPDRSVSIAMIEPEWTLVMMDGQGFAAATPLVPPVLVEVGDRKWFR